MRRPWKAMGGRNERYLHWNNFVACGDQRRSWEVDMRDTYAEAFSYLVETIAGDWGYTESGLKLVETIWGHGRWRYKMDRRKQD